MADAEYDNLDLLLCRYLDGDLSRREQAKLEARLADEPALREELRLYASLDGHLPDLAGEAPAGVDYVRQRADIMAAVEREALLAAAPRRLLFRPAALGALAAAAAVLMIVSAGLLYLLATPGARPTVVVEVVPPAAPRAGAAVVSLELRPPTAAPPRPPGEGPPGAALRRSAVVVSFAEAEPPGNGSLDDQLVIY